MKRTGTIYFYNLNSEKGRKIRMICLKQGIGICVVKPEQYAEAIGALAGVSDYTLTGMPYLGDGFTDEMLLMQFYTSQGLDRFLQEFRRAKIEPVALKAVLTETNIGWNSIELHRELVQEHAAMHEGKERIHGDSEKNEKQ